MKLNRARIQQVKDLCKMLDSSALKEKVLVIDNNCITTLKHILIEWIVRADPSHELPLHDLLSDYGITDILKSSNSIEEKYQKIYEIIDGSHDLKYAIRFEPLVTMVSSASLKLSS